MAEIFKNILQLNFKPWKSQTDPVPKFINREYTDRTLLDKSDSFKYDARDVGGEDRYKYFRRPVVPCAQAPADVVLEPTKVIFQKIKKYFLNIPVAVFIFPRKLLYDWLNSVTSYGFKVKNIARYEESTDATRTMATQTDYRDQETQTDPYSPEYKVVPGEAPEILTLAALRHGRGLPAGKDYFFNNSLVFVII